MRLLAQALLAVQIALAVALPVLSDSRDALRQRLDSLEVETQVRKRSGKPIDALEAASAQLRDSIVGMRSALPPEAVPVPAGGDGAFFERTVSAFASFLDSAFSFKPAGLFDWIIVSTGVVAVLSGLLLSIGIAAGRRKGAATKKNAAKPAHKVINLGAGALSRMPGVPAPPVPLPPPEPPQPQPSLESLMDTLRKVSQQPQPQQSALPPEPLPVPPLSSPQLPPALPLIVNARDSSVSSKRPAVPKAGSPGFNESIAADAESGLSDVEISRRYQIPVDQVRLMLRMKQDG